MNDVVLNYDDKNVLKNPPIVEMILLNNRQNINLIEFWLSGYLENRLELANKLEA